MGYCTGIENYSRHLDGRKPGDPPAVLLDYFPADFLLFIDESHITVRSLTACTGETAPVRERWLITASGFHQPLTTGLCV